MLPLCRTLVFASLLLSPVMAAQTAVDPTGRWEGSVQAPEMTIEVVIDLAKNSKGILAGTFTQPAQGVKGLPLSTVIVEGRTVRFVVKGGPEASTFEGALAPDAKSMTGTITQGSFSAPFSLTRTGDAKIAAAPKNAPIGKELEGTWNGALDVGGRPMRLVVKMANHPDGSATGTIVSPDGSGVEIPIGMTQKGSKLTIDVPSVDAVFVGELNAAATELVGTWTQRGSVLPLTLQRDKR